MKLIILLAAALFFLAPHRAAAQRIRAMDFRGQNIVDILMVLAEVSGRSIVPDETVQGQASFHFGDMELQDALEVFLAAHGLYRKQEGGVIVVSRIDAHKNDETGLLSLRADGAGAESIVRALARQAEYTVLYDTLPRTAMTVDMRDLSLRAALELVLVMLPDFSLESGEGYFCLRRNSSAREAGTASGRPAVPGPDAGAAREFIQREGDLFSARIGQGKFFQVLAELFEKGGREYSILARADAPLENLYFSGRDFDGLLRLILEQGNADYAYHNGVYYIVEIQRRDVLKKLRETRVLQIRHIAAQDFPALLPQELAGSGTVKVDKNGNTVILSGTAEEIEPLVRFAALVDRPQENFPCRRIDLAFVSAADLLPLLSQRFAGLAPAALPGGRAIVAQGPEEQLDALTDFVARTDRREGTFPVQLRYIRIEDLLKNLPPSIRAEDISDSGFPNLGFFRGPEEKRAAFLRELELVDRPRPQIRYELLVVEYLKSRETGVNRGISAASGQALSPGGLERGSTGAGAGTARAQPLSFLGNLSNVFNLNFDVVSQFGYQFALNLSAQLGEHSAQVYADTTMNGLSGQEIRFQNTDTYRYQEFEIDPDTGSLIRSGVTREISSGLIVSLSGWVSGDDMITITVNATVSKQNSNPASGSSTGIPSTSERIITTQIRTPSGQPIVLSGLIKEDSGRTVKKVPLLGDIPLLRHFFGDSHETRERTEIVIYIVPYLLRDGGDMDTARRVEETYRRFFEAPGGLSARHTGSARQEAAP